MNRKIPKKAKIIATLLIVVIELSLIGQISIFPPLDKAGQIGHTIATIITGIIAVVCIVIIWYIKPGVDDPDAKYKLLAKDLRSGKSHWYLVGINRNSVWTLDVLSPYQVSSKRNVRAQKTTQEVKQALGEGRVSSPSEVQKILDLLDQT